MSLHTEIHEQPETLRRLIADGRENVERIAQNLRTQDARFVFLAARGTSDNAGRYANYLWGAANRLPVALATPSLFTLYEQPPQMRGALVVGISQSGQSPDIVSVLTEGRRQGCPTLAITNQPDSPLGQAADFIIDIQAGDEKAVAATKTYTAQLTAIAMLSAALAGQESMWAELARVPDWIAESLKEDARIERLVERFRYMDQCVVLGRGYNYCTAFEWAQKVKELTYVVADAYSSADFRHGPVAMVERGFPVLAVVPEGRVFGSMVSMLQQLRNDHLAELVVISNASSALDLAQSPIRLPAGMPEWVSPIVSIVPGQLFSHHLTVVKGFNTEAPRNIRKVTETR